LMATPLREFVLEADRVLDLVRAAGAVPEPQLLPFMENQRRLGFLRDLVGRARVLAHCYESLWALADRCRDFQNRLRDLPPDRPGSNVRTLPSAWVDEEERWLEEVDALTSLVYYEVTSIVGMLRQLNIALHDHQEVKFLVKVRDRFLSHVQLSGVRRGQAGGWSLPETGYLHRDVVALSSWSAEDLRALGPNAVAIGSREWEAQRRINEELVLSAKRNEDFTQQELSGLLAAGVRECNLELVHQQLADLLKTQLMPLITSETQRAVGEFGFEKWPEGA
jgi:hypothetical protein